VLLCRSRGWAVPVSNQPQYSALWRRIEARVLPACEAYGLGNVVWSPLAMGILTGKYADASHPPAGTRAAGPYREMMEDYFTQPVLDAVQQLKPVAQRNGISLSQLSLAWALRQRAVTSTIVGATNTKHIADNVAAGDITLDEQTIADVDRILVPVAPAEPYLA
jgi:aryl-alcohol dehydrogenase-like predicted oxidoreductase